MAGTEKHSYVYIMTNRVNRVLYTGVTNDLVRRVFEHRNGMGEGFTARYKVNKLVYFEVFRDIEEAINRENQIKGGSRKKKLALVERMNPEWRDLYEEIIS
ncbi:MAG: GIY-YIG nuclease family protein [Proteobacteria bacterium]|nr:GIY-YIG nuclease family protein [Pseudomonadota bacterium]